jgi:GTP-binding protein
MFALEANEDQLDFPVVFGSAKQGWMSHDWKNQASDINVLLDDIIKYIP